MSSDGSSDMLNVPRRCIISVLPFVKITKIHERDEKMTFRKNCEPQNYHIRFERPQSAWSAKNRASLESRPLWKIWTSNLFPTFLFLRLTGRYVKYINVNHIEPGITRHEMVSNELWELYSGLILIIWHYSTYRNFIR